jgi:hypothetical protein
VRVSGNKLCLVRMSHWYDLCEPDDTRSRTRRVIKKYPISYLHTISHIVASLVVAYSEPTRWSISLEVVYRVFCRFGFHEPGGHSWMGNWGSLLLLRFSVLFSIGSIPVPSLSFRNFFEDIGYDRWVDIWHQAEYIYHLTHNVSYHSIWVIDSSLTEFFVELAEGTQTDIHWCMTYREIWEYQ